MFNNIVTIINKKKAYEQGNMIKYITKENYCRNIQQIKK